MIESAIKNEYKSDKANSVVYLMDCMEGMKHFPDKHFDLAIVDPEYGIGASKPSKKPNIAKQKNGTISNVKHIVYKQKEWDNEPAKYDYFIELKRVSKHQIIWGVNYYDFNLKGGRIVWDKMNGESDQFGCEIAYCSLNNRTDIIRYLWSGMFQGEYISKNVMEAKTQQGNKSLNENRIHPTQKPVKLYKWLLQNYAKEGDKILDTHYGSGSHGIACYDMGFDLTAFELDEDYFNDSNKRFKQHVSQLTIF